MNETNPQLTAALKDILDLQRNAFMLDPVVPLEIRRDRLNRLLALTVDNAVDIAHAIREDFSGARSIHMTLLTEMVSKAAGIEHARDHLAQWMAPQARKSNPMYEQAGATSEVTFQPKGVVGIISPWNVPFGLTISPLTSALAAGNRVMIKPSEYTPTASALFAKLFPTYFDENEVAVVLGGPTVGSVFARLAFDHLLFTGSTKVGREIMRCAAENLVPVTLELGGKCPVVVGKSANLDQVAATLSFGKVLNGGQLCLSPDYALVPREHEENFVALVATQIASMYPSVAGNPDFTGVINEVHFHRLQGHVDDARQKGARITVVGGEAVEGRSDRRFPVHLIQGATREMTVMQEEIFGPLLPVVTYGTIDEAVEFVARGDKPLGLYYFGEDKREEQFVLQRTQSGGATVNDILQHYVQEDLPFGGVGASGMGAYHGHDGFLTFSHAKAVFRQTSRPLVSLFRPPFGDELRGWLDSELDRRKSKVAATEVA